MSLRGMFVLVLIMLGIATLGSFTIIDPGEYGVVTHLGKVDESQVLGPGPHLTMPFYTGVHKFNCRVHATELEAAAASKDLQAITAKVVVQWHPDSSKIMDIYNKIGDEDAVEVRIMGPTINEVIKANTAQLTAEEVVSKRMILKQGIDTAFAERMKAYNVIVDDINIVHLDFSAEFNKAIEAKQVAEQKAKQAAYEAQQAIQQGNAILAKAKGEAEAQRLQRTTLTDLMVQREAIAKWDGHLPQIIGGNGAIPLINLRAASAAAATADKGEDAK